jgi:hypothetical protein
MTWKLDDLIYCFESLSPGFRPIQAKVELFPEEAEVNQLRQ